MGNKKCVAPPRYNKKFKEGAIPLVTEQERPSEEVASELDICIYTLRNWLKAAGAPFPRQADPQNREAKRARELEAEVRLLRKRLSEKEEVIEIRKNP